VRIFVLRLAVLVFSLVLAGPAFAADMPITITASSSSLAYGGMKIALEAGLFQ
jgi:hypothetical protein